MEVGVGRPKLSARVRAALRQPECAPAAAILGLLLFCWPLVREPRLGLGETFVHLFGWWAALIAALAMGAWALKGPRDREGDVDDDG